MYKNMSKIVGTERTSSFNFKQPYLGSAVMALLMGLMATATWAESTTISLTLAQAIAKT